MERQREAELEAQKSKEEEGKKEREQMERRLADSKKEIDEAQRKLEEERQAIVEEQRKLLEERQRLEDERKRAVGEEQAVILNKKGTTRPRIGFSLKNSWHRHAKDKQNETTTTTKQWWTNALSFPRYISRGRPAVYSYAHTSLCRLKYLVIYFGRYYFSRFDNEFDAIRYRIPFVQILCPRLNESLSVGRVYLLFCLFDWFLHPCRNMNPYDWCLSIQPWRVLSPFVRE